MSLERCPECGGFLSSDANACPHCGYRRDCGKCFHKSMDSDGHYYCTYDQSPMKRCKYYEYDDTESD